MGILLGVDIGTSSVRAVAFNENAKVVARKSIDYHVSIPKVGYAEQDPQMWYECVTKVLKSVQECISSDNINALSFSGQMHGLVCVNKSYKIIRPAIIWQDQRTKYIIREMYDILGENFVRENTQNTISTGFLIASLYWIYKNDIDSYKNIYKVMLPKDYIKFRLTGEIITDYSDAAGSLAFNNIKNEWSYELIEKLGLNIDLFPECSPSTEIIGNISSIASEETGLSKTIKVINGGTDQCMQGIGSGIVSKGVFSCNIGTGGQISTCSNKPFIDIGFKVNTFAHVIPNSWNIMAACLSSGSSLKWLTQNIIGIDKYREMDEEVSKISAGSEGLIFLPYLVGERTPHLDPDARGVFFGLTLKHNKYHMARAVMEGVVYSLKDCMNVIYDMGLTCNKLIASGGGANSAEWLQIQADILGCKIHKSKVTEQASLGAAITAGVGISKYKDFPSACQQLIEFDNIIYEPNSKNKEIYDKTYEIFKELYQVNKNLFQKL